MNPPLNVYWWKDVLNFGDALTNTLLNHYHVQHKWASVQNAELIITGSILEHLPAQWKGTIIGSGRLYEDSYLEIPEAKILALRGPLTARGLHGDFALGDPGLLAPLLIPTQAVKQDLGVVPHWSDEDLIKRFAYGRLISSKNGAMYVITEIARCRRIVTSSLHGAIVADALGIPRQIELPPRLIHGHEGGDFKFRDYSASIGTKLEYGRLIQADQNLVKIRQGEIEDAMVQITTPGFYSGAVPRE